MNLKRYIKIDFRLFPKGYTVYADIGNNNPNLINKLDIPDIELEADGKR